MTKRQITRPSFYNENTEHLTFKRVGYYYHDTCYHDIYQLENTEILMTVFQLGSVSVYENKKRFIEMHQENRYDYLIVFFNEKNEESIFIQKKENVFQKIKQKITKIFKGGDKIEPDT